MIIANPPFAHTPNFHGYWHDLIEHLRNVARLASKFAESINASDAASILGWWHDSGKLNPDWQTYLKLSEKGFMAKSPGHSMVGAHKLLESGAHPLLALSIACHHTGLKDINYIRDEYHKVKRKEIDYSYDFSKIIENCSLHKTNLPPIFFPKNEIERTKTALIFRMLYSCLIDADWIDTESHYSRRKFNIRNSTKPSIQSLLNNLESSQKELMKNATGKVNESRRQMSIVTFVWFKRPEMPSVTTTYKCS